MAGAAAVVEGKAKGPGVMVVLGQVEMVVLGQVEMVVLVRVVMVVMVQAGTVAGRCKRRCSLDRSTTRWGPPRKGPGCSCRTFHPGST